MNKFTKRELSEENFFEDDQGIQINKLLELIKSSPYYSNVLEYFSLDENDDTLIEVPGARTMYAILKTISREYIKVDLSSSLHDVYFDYKDGFKIEFLNTANNPYFNEIGVDHIVAKPIHSATRDFFKNLFDMDKFARNLMNKGFSDILDQTLDALKSKGDFTKKYRLLHGIEDNIFYLRALISEDRYYNYDNNFTFVIALLKLHHETKLSGVQYYLSSSEYNESYLKLYFRTSETKELKGVGHLHNTLMVSNDEIKREALRFSTICTISFKAANDTTENMYIQPKDIKTSVLSMSHGTGPNKGFKNLENFVKSKKVFERLCNEIQSITKIKDHSQIVHLVKTKIENSKKEAIQGSKEDLKKILLKDIKNTSQLLETFNKLILLDGLEIEAKEYLRYVIYEALVDRK